MNIIFRILLAIYAFCLTIASIVTMMIIFKPVLFAELSDFIGGVLEDRTATFVMFLIAFVFFGLSMTFLLSGVKSDKDKKSVSKYTNIGEIKISLDTIESIALGASKRLNGVKESKAYVVKLHDSVSIAIKAIVLGDINIPSLCEDIQAKVKKSVEESSGVGVNDVKVLVENISTGYKSRVE